MSNNDLLSQIDVREQVANSLVHKMLNSSPEIQEKILRMLVNRMPRREIDTWYIAMNLYEPHSEPHTLTDFLHKEHEHQAQEQEGEK